MANILKNPSFELGTSGHLCRVYTPTEYYETERGEVAPPTDWNVWYYHAPGSGQVPHDPDNIVGYAEPETRPNNYRKATGSYSYMLFTFYRIHRGGLYQQVRVNPGDTLTLNGLAHAWSSSDDIPQTSDGVGAGPYFALSGTPGLTDAQRNFTFKIGIDPTGGTNPFGDTVVWGNGAHIYNVFAQVPPVSVIATSNTATIFTREDVLYPLCHCDGYWDDIVLTTTAPEPPETECPQPREPYERLNVLIPPTYGFEWIAALEDVWNKRRFSINASADDAHYGPGLPKRTVLALNPADWNGDLEAFGQQYYGTIAGSELEYVPVIAATPTEFAAKVAEYYADPPSPPSPPPSSGGKLGAHILRATSDIALTHKAPVVKLVGDWGLADKYSGLVIGRYPIEYAAQGDYIAGKSPQQAADEFMASQLQTINANPLIEYWEGPNEPVWTNSAGVAWYAQFEIERTNRLAAMNKKAVIANFSAGELRNMEWWPAFLPAIAHGLQNGAILGLHEYSCPWMWWMTGSYQIDPDEDEGDEGWTTLRYRKVYRQFLEPAGLGAMPLVITETGLDPGINPRPPGTPPGTWKQLADFWRTNDNRPDTAQYYFDQLRWYEEELKKDKYVKGATVFTWGSYGPPWDAFDVANTEVAQLLGEHWAKETPVVPPEPEPEIAILDVRDQLATNPASPWYPWKKRTLSEITHIFVHHSAGALSSSLDTVKAIATYHTAPAGKNRPGICYTYVIGADGTVWYVSDIENVVFSQGSADYPGDENRFGLGCCLLGNFTGGKEPTAAQLQSLEKLIAYTKRELGRTLKVWGHKDVTSTQCPGDSWPWKPEWGRYAPAPPVTAFSLGVHSSPVPYPTSDNGTLVSRLKALGVREYKMLDDGNPANNTLIQSLLTSGIQPIVRMYQQGQFPGRLAAPLMERARELYGIGARLFEIGNEPNLTGEWQSGLFPGAGWQDTAAVNAIAARWWADAVEMIGWGGKPAFYAMAPTERGGINPLYSSVMWAKRVVDWLAANKRAEMIQYINGGNIWLAVHTSPFNRPFDFDPVQPWGTDDMCIRGHEPLQAYFREKFGVVPITRSTEGGVYSPSHMAELGWDSPYTWETWGSYTLAAHNWLKNHGTLHSLCTWVFTDQGNQWFPGCGWYDNNGNPRTPVAAMTGWGA